MIRRVLLNSGILIFCIVLQSTLLRYVAISDVIPNLYLIYLVYTSFNNSGLHGSACGFITGLVEDTLSISPLGFHGLIKTIIGSIYSSFNGLIILDRIIMPMMLVLIATVLNRILAFGVVSAYSLSIPAHSIFSKYFLIEIGYTTILTPFVFFIADAVRNRFNPRGYV